MIRASIPYLLSGLLLTVAISASAEIYKWQDADGSWHFSETPPNHQNTETLKIKTTPPSSIDSDNTNNDEPDTATADNTEEPLPLSPEIVAAEKERRAHNCKVAKDNLFSLDTSTRIRYQDKEQGVERYLTDEERIQWRKNSTQQVNENCD